MITFVKGEKYKIQKIITDLFIESLKEGRAIWNSNYTLFNAKNLISNKSYRGVNSFILASYSDNESNYFLTFNQANEIGLKIKKGAKGIPIVFYKIKQYVSNENETKNILIPKLKTKQFPILRYYNVFKITDCVDYKDNSLFKKRFTEFKINDNQKDFDSDEIFNNYPAIKPKLITNNKITPHFSISDDTISMPNINNFKTTDDYYYVLFHELTHSTGIEKRLNRGLELNFDKTDYAFEELVAELGASLLRANCKLEMTDNLIYNSKAYIRGWISRLENNPDWIIKASSLAQKSTDYILEIKQDKE